MSTWIFAHNPFLRATDNSYINGMDISTYHDSALAEGKSDPVISGLYVTYHPVHLKYKSAYDSWKAHGGAQQSETLNVSQLLNLLNHKIQQWDVKIQNIYPADTVRYKKLLPDHRKPFQTGKQNERISAVKGLSENIGADELLAAVKTDVDTFYAQLDAAISTQKGSISGSKNLVSALEAARLEICTGQFANLGALMQKFASTPEKIEQYFNVSVIRTSHQVFFTGRLRAGETLTIVKHTFSQGDEVILTNPGNTPLKFYLAGIKNMQPGATSVLVEPGEQTVTASNLGKLTDSFLTVFNTDPIHDGVFHVELI